MIMDELILASPRRLHTITDTLLRTHCYGHTGTYTVTDTLLQTHGYRHTVKDTLSMKKHITHICKSSFIQLQIVLITYKAVCGLPPHYICELVQLKQYGRRLRPDNLSLLTQSLMNRPQFIFPSSYTHTHTHARAHTHTHT